MHEGLWKLVLLSYENDRVAKKWHKPRHIRVFCGPRKMGVGTYIFVIILYLATKPCPCVFCGCRLGPVLHQYRASLKALLCFRNLLFPSLCNKVRRTMYPRGAQKFSENGSKPRKNQQNPAKNGTNSAQKTKKSSQKTQKSSSCENIARCRRATRNSRAVSCLTPTQLMLIDLKNGASERKQAANFGFSRGKLKNLKAGVVTREASRRNKIDAFVVATFQALMDKGLSNKAPRQHKRVTPAAVLAEWRGVGCPSLQTVRRTMQRLFTAAQLSTRRRFPAVVVDENAVPWTDNDARYRSYLLSQNFW